MSDAAITTSHRPREKSDQPFGWMNLDRIRDLAQETSSPVKRARDEIKYQVEHGLFNGLLRPGDFLGTEQDLSDLFGMSRMPIRDALKALQAQGLVNVRVGKSGGVYVADDDKKGLADALSSQIHLLGCAPEEVFQAQGQLLAAAVELATENLSAEDFRTLEKSLHHMRGALDNDEEFMQETVKYLLYIARVAGNSILLFQIESLFDFIIKHHYPYDVQTSGEKVVRLHSKLLKLLREGDKASAREHVVKYTAWISTLRRPV